MSELNVYHHELRPNEYAEFYLKYEADKVIAEKDKVIAYAQALVLKDIEIIRHQKFKRCLAMVDALTWEHNYLVDFVSSDFPNVRFKRNHRIKWVNKWLELAEKFKEAR